MKESEAKELLTEWLRHGGAFETMSDRYREALRSTLAALTSARTEVSQAQAIISAVEGSLLKATTEIAEQILLTEEYRGHFKRVLADKLNLIEDVKLAREVIQTARGWVVTCSESATAKRDLQKIDRWLTDHPESAAATWGKENSK